MAVKKDEAVNIADVTKQIEEMLAKAKAEAEKIVADAKSATGANASEERKKFVEESNARGEEYVEVKLFKDNNRYKDDVFVQVNGENCVIKRGERVKVKRKFADVLDNSDMQDYETSKLIERKSSEFSKIDM
jgi:hypothetical protein